MAKREMPGDAYVCLHVYIDSSNTAGRPRRASTRPCGSDLYLGNKNTIWQLVYSGLGPFLLIFSCGLTLATQTPSTPLNDPPGLFLTPHR